MEISIVTPAPRGSRSGNRVTALRWGALLRGLGHRVRLSCDRAADDANLLVALHARRSASAIDEFHGRGPVILALTGTDLYRDIKVDSSAQRSVELASRLVVLQGAAFEELEPALREKAVVILQSAVAITPPAPRSTEGTAVCVIGHLRAEKDPFRVVEALEQLPPESSIRVLHIGNAIDPSMAVRANLESARSNRYRWTGELRRAATMRQMAASDVLVLSSLIEGGANVLSEAIVNGIPVISSSIPSSISILGSAYPAFFEAGNTAELAKILSRFERDAGFRRDLQSAVQQLQPLFAPSRERDAWSALLEGL